MLEVAKGGFALAYQRSIEGVSFEISEAWRKFNDTQIPEKQKPAYLRVIKDCHESMMQLTINGPAVLQLQDITRRAERAGINFESDNVGLNLETVK